MTGARMRGFTGAPGRLRAVTRGAGALLPLSVVAWALLVPRCIDLHVHRTDAGCGRR